MEQPDGRRLVERPGRPSGERHDRLGLSAQARVTRAGSASAPCAAATPEQQEGFKKTGERGRRAAAAHPDAAVEVWAMDEHRIGLQPVLRRVWAPRGHRP